MTQTGYAPVRSPSGEVIGVVGADPDVHVIEQGKAQIKTAGITALLIASCIAVASGILFSLYLTHPIRAPSTGVQKVSQGNLDTLVSVDRNDEFGTLAESFNAMIREIKRMQLELKEYSGKLIQQEKLAAIGQLSAGIAHEMNTPLGYVMSMAPAWVSPPFTTSSSNGMAAWLKSAANRADWPPFPYVYPLAAQIRTIKPK